MAARVISASLEGGDALRKHLLVIEKQLGKGAGVNVGFLESATYSGARASHPKPSPLLKNKIRRFVDFVHGQETYTGPVAQVALWNEFGTSGSPPRPFIRDMVRSKSPRWGIGLGVALKKTNYDARESLRIMGEGIAGQMKESITSFKTPPNSAVTQAIKGFNKPLIDSATMLNAVDFQVVESDA